MAAFIQEAWLGLLTLVGAAGSFSIRRVLNRIDSLERYQVQQRILVAEGYISKSDFEKAIVRIESKLDRLLDKLDQKADKSDWNKTSCA